MGLIPSGGRVLAAVSGGPDSVCLAHVLWRLRARHRFTLALGHVHHGLRGREADADLAGVARLARRLDVPLVTARLHLRPGPGLEAEAREQRYAAFRRLAKRTGAACLATGHTASDQVETLLLWLFRGAGADGLGGIPDSRPEGEGPLRVVRPLLGIWREEVERYLTIHRMGWRVDRTNRVPDRMRNRVRMRLLPVLERFDRRARKALLRAGELLAGERSHWERWVQDHAGWVTRRGEGYVVDLPHFLGYTLGERRRLLYAFLTRRLRVAGVGFALVEQLVNTVSQERSGRQVSLPGGWMAERGREELRFTIR